MWTLIAEILIYGCPGFLIVAKWSDFYELSHWEYICTDFNTNVSKGNKIDQTTLSFVGDFLWLQSNFRGLKFEMSQINMSF